MYSYYTCRALRIAIPKFVNIFITMIQILQMIFGVYVNVAVYLAKKNGRTCYISDQNINFGFFMYFTYLILFANFFVQSYIKPKTGKKMVSIRFTSFPVNFID